MSFPATIDDFTPKVDNTDDVMAVDVNELQTAIESLETKIGVDDSAVATSVDYLLKNAASIDPGHLHTGSSVELLEIGNATYDDLQDFVNSVQSSGFISGFTLSNSREALELDVAAGLGMIKITDSAIGVTKFFDFAGVQNVTLTADNINYIYVDYNAGTPQIVATTDRSTIELNRHIILGRVYKNGTTLHILNSGVCVCNIIRKDHERLVERDGFDYISGAILSEVGSLNLALTAGVWYMGLNRVTTGALDTSVADTFEYKHYGTASWITDNALATAIDCTHYNDGDDVLGSLGVNNYGVQWAYITTDSKMWIIYGTENGTLTTAEAATPPASLPIYLETMGELVAKIIVRQSGSIISILATQAETYSASAVSNHNELGGLQGGAANDYYHLTAAQHTIATQAADTDNSGYLLTADWDTFNNKQAALTFGIADTNAVKIDDADAADNDYAKLTATGIEGRSYAEVRTDLGLVIGTNVLAEQTIGIANDNLVEIDSADVADNNYAKFTANGLEGRTAAEMKTDLSFLTDMIDDTTPELGGEMDCGAHSIGFTQQVATGDGTTTIDWKLGNKFKFTFGAANETFTFTAPSNPCNLVLVLIQDGTGSRTATFPGTVKWVGGTAPTLSTAANSIDIVSLYYDGTNYFGVASLLFAVPA